MWDKLTDLTSFWGILCYWVPLAVCFFGYLIKAKRTIQADIKDRSESNYYQPKFTVGWIVWHLFVTVCPIVNLLAAVFDLSKHYVAEIFQFCSKMLDIPLIPDSKKYEDRRKARKA